MKCKYKNCAIYYSRINVYVYVDKIEASPRNQGFGSRALKLFAKRYETSNIILFASAEDDYMSQPRLNAWYKRMGFTHVRGRYQYINDFKFNYILERC